MSMSAGGVPRPDAGEMVAEFSAIETANAAVSKLIAAEVPARDIAIVGIGLRSVERITGRLGYATAARSGAVNGMFLGLLFSALFVLGDPKGTVQAFIGVLLVGIAIGMLFSLVMYAVIRRRRDFASVSQVVADRYEVRVAPASVHKARSALGTPVTPATPERVVPDGPPRYGERIAPDAEPPAYGERVTPPAEDEPASPEQRGAE